MLYLRDISIGYGRKVVASGITAHLRRGLLTCLIGRNGTGKSTLLRTIAGLLPPLRGVMEFTSLADDGSDSAAFTSARRHATQVALVLPERIRVEHLTVYDLIATSRIPYTGFWGTLCAADRAAIEGAMRLTATTPLSDRDVTTLSDGEYQKVMIARAVAQQTPLILLDEPTAFLDYESKHEAFAMLRRLCHDEGKTVLLSTHDVDVARKYADEVWERFNEGMKE